MRFIPLLTLLVCVLANFAAALIPPDKLKEISEQGSKYITEQFENALNGVRQMKELMDQTGKEHQEILRTLEETKKSKEDALKKALETEQKLSETPVCNDTMLALWEECKPCLKQTCVRFYSKTCRTGSGLVGRQLEEFLNRSSPFSIWINGEKVDTLNKEDEQQHMVLEDLEDGFSILEDSVHDLFQDSLKVFDQMKPVFSRPFHSSFSRPVWNPFPFRGESFPAIRIRKERSPLYDPLFTSNFDSLFEAAQKMMERHRLFDERFDETGNSTNDKMVCRELRRNTAGCLKMTEKCEKCKEILEVDCSGKDVPQKHLKEEFEDSLRVAEKFTQQYNELLQRFQARMLNTSSILEDMGRQFSWVSKLANLTEDEKNQFFQVSTAYSSDEGAPGETTVTVNLFKSEPFTFTVPGRIDMADPKFGELVAQEALKRFQADAIEAA
ncbi:clusterin isoform 1-T2 [Gastrophryne carolinensis]